MRFIRQLRAGFRQGAVLCAVAIALACVTLPAPSALAACSTTGTNQNCTVDPGVTVSGGGTGIDDNNNLTVTNFGTVTGTVYGIFTTGNANVTNYGVISGGAQYGIRAGDNITLYNYGSIIGSSAGIAGVFFNNDGTIVNSGTISGPRGIIAGGNVLNLTNSGWVIGTNGAAIDMGFSTGDTLNLQPGSRIVGGIILGANDNINIRTGGDIAWLLNFGACGCGGLVGTGAVVTFSGGGIGIVVGDQVATLDPTAFGLNDRTLLEFTGNISALLSSRFGGVAPATTGSTAFAAAAHPVSDLANSAFAGIPGLAYAGEGLAPNASANYAQSGIGVWTKAFFGIRAQASDGPNLAATTIGYGSVIGIDKTIAADLRLGAFAGAGAGRLSVDRDSQTVKSNYAFAGLYGRYRWAAQFIDFAMSAGHSTNHTDRQIANNSVSSGLETATASYHGWFVSPELTYGYNMPLGGHYVLTPSARLRYLASFFGSYTESGSAQTLSVSSRTTHNLEQRLELALTRTTPVDFGWLQTTATAGLLANERIGSSSINTVLIGQNLSFTTPGRNTAGGVYAGLGFDMSVARAVNLFAATQVTVMSDRSISGLAQGGVRAQF